MIDFTNIRGGTIEGQRSSFEQLVCHLAKVDGGGGEFRRIEGAGGDGGVEALRILPSGRKIGYQAKYYPSRDYIDWSKLDKSVQTALTQHPELERYVIALPCDFTGKRAARGGSTEGIWGKWDKQVENWETLAVASGMTVEFVPWTAFEIEAALLRPDAQHLIRFFFDRLVFTREWMRRHLDRTIHDLQARYSPGEHVDTESLKPFDVIYRRKNVCRDLGAVFEVARNSDPRAAAALVEGAGIPEADIIATEDSLQEFLALGDAISWTTERGWPICKWFTSWYSFTRHLISLNSAIRDRFPPEKTTDYDVLDRRVEEKTKEYKLTGPEVFGGRWAHLIPIDGSRATIFVGRAGAGKSHALARGTEIAWNTGAPVVHILGQHILDDDPRASILKRLEIAGWSFHDALSALNLAAEAAGTRAMLVIDALSEGRGTDVWRSHLASFIREVNEHDRVVLVMSCREEYLDYVVPPEVIADPHPYPGQDGQPPEDCAPLGKLVRVSVDGFQTTEEREVALQKFMDDKGIARPTAPVLDSEFFNPLFMSSVCRSMAKAGIKVFPRGLHGARDIFKFVLATKARALGTHHDGTDQVHKALLTALNELAGKMVERREDCVPLRDAIDLIDSTFRAFPISDRTWLDVLERSDILRRDVEESPKEIGPWSRPAEVVRFSFQRLQDNLIAERLIDECRDIDIEGVFEPDAPFSFLLHRSVREDGIAILEPSARWIGVLGALWSAVAETYSKELWDLRSFFGSPDVHFYAQDFQPVFHASIRERTVTAFTQRTRDILNGLWKDEQEEKLVIILSTSCVPGHAWNADCLGDRLISLSLADRDSAWSRHFTNVRSELVDPAMQIVNWGLNVDARTADAEVARLAAITLTWLFTVTNRTIRDRATKALANLLVGAPSLFPDLIGKFRTVDDLYVLDRILAAGYGAICLDPTERRINASAQAVACAIFRGAEPPVHLSIRDWARSILERAAERNLVPANFNMARARSPFGSAPVEFNVTKDELAEIATAAGDDGIARSCQQFSDFFTYVIKGQINDFSESLLTEPAPLTQIERADRFEASVKELGGNPVDRLDNLLLAAEAARKEELPSITISETPFSISIRPRKRSKKAEEKIKEAEEAFVNSLPETLRMKYTADLAPKIHGEFEPPDRRDPEPVGLWIARRAYQLGWTKDRFPQEPYSRDRGRPVIERIGKKYQWIALEEFMARMADNFWIKAGCGKGTRIYQFRQDIWRWGRIDPTILPPKIGISPHPLGFIGPPPLLIENVEDPDLVNWPFRVDHFDDPEPWLTGLLDGRQWLIGDWSESINERHPIYHATVPFRRQVQAFVCLVAHKAGDRQQVVDGFLRDHSRGIDGWSLKTEIEGYFAHEFALLSPEEIPFWRPADFDRVDLASPIVTGVINGDTDRSIEGIIRYTVPHPRLSLALGLSIPDPRNTGFWLLPDGQVFLRELEGRGSPLLLDREHFDAWCRSEGLDYTWIYIGERTAWPSQKNAKWRRTLGAAWFDDGKVRCRNDQRDR